jgi:two-component system response regulator NreC
LITIVLADDHHVMRQGLHSLLDAENDFQVVGEAGDGDEAIRLVEAQRPNVLVVDMVMPGTNGLGVIQRLRQTTPKTEIIVLSMFGTEGYVNRAMRAGAKAYVLKQATGNELVSAIRAVAAGRRYLSQTISDQAIDAYIKERASGDLDPLVILTSREQEVLRMIAGGNNGRQVASKLKVSIRTVEFHRANIMHKLDIHSQRDLILYCIRANMMQDQGHHPGADDWPSTRED